MDHDASRFRRLIREYGPLVLAFAFIAAAFQPWSIRCTLNDDWAYLPVAFRLADTGELRLSDWTLPTQVLHIAWGALFATFAPHDVGFLKIGMQLWLFAAAAMLYALLRRHTVRRDVAFLAAAALIFNPVILLHAFTYMTDVPYLTLTIAAAVCAARLGDDTSPRSLWLGALAAAGAYLIRQIGAALPVAATIVLWRQRKLTARNLLIAWGPVIITVAIHQWWFRAIHGPTWASEHSMGDATADFLSDPVRLTSETALRLAALAPYLGLFAWPLLAGVPLNVWRQLPRRTWIVAGAVGLIALALFLIKGPMPVLPNTLRLDGIGVVMIVDQDYRPAGFFVSTWFWPFITACAVAGAVLLAALLSPATRINAAALALWSTLIVQLAATLPSYQYFDRYYMAPLACALLLLGLRLAETRFVFWRAWVALLLLATVTTFGIKDYLAWNLARWDLAQRLVAQGVPPSQIGAGMDWLGYHTYEPAIAELRQRKYLKDIGEWDWQSQFPRQYQISFDSGLERIGFKRLEVELYATPLDDHLGAVYLYQMNPHVLINTADKAAAQGDLELAILCYRSALLIGPDAETYNRLGIAYAQDRRFDEAIICFEQALHIQPDHGPAMENLQRARNAMKSPADMGR